MASIMNRLILALILTGLIHGYGFADEWPKDWESVDFAKTKVDAAKLKDIPLERLKLIRGIVFGRHGRIFKEFEIEAFLKKRAWYKPNPRFSNAVLNDTERENL